MRRAGGYSGHGGYGGNSAYQMLEDENDQMVDSLSNKVQALKSLSIDIGNEVKYQNTMLGEMDGEFDSTGSFLSGTMNRLTALTKKGHHKNLCYVLLFCFFVMMVAWFYIRWLK